MENKKVLRFELRQMLAAKGLTYEEFGKRFTPEMDKGAVSKLTRRSSITFEMLERIVNALELEPEEIAQLIRVY